MHYFTSITLAFTLLTGTNAIPTLSERSTAQCPGMSHLTPEVNCPSGFIGCAPYERGSAVCKGPKRFYNDCSGEPNLGSFRRCEVAGVVTFIGCTTNPGICDTSAPAPKLSDPVMAPPKDTIRTQSWSCPPGTWYAKTGECSSGFVGCTNVSPQVCGGEKRFWSSCPLNHGNFYNCANGFLGCTTNNIICG